MYIYTGELDPISPSCIFLRTDAHKRLKAALWSLDWEFLNLNQGDQI